jgi:hypothetical protein
MTTAQPRFTAPLNIRKSQLEEAIERARNQEIIYGHNTGHFTLKVEKENTVIGVLGEIAIRDWLNNFFTEQNISKNVKLCQIGSSSDLEISSNNSVTFVHVKSGLWKRWPNDEWHFGIHSDQGISSSGYPLVLVSFLKANTSWPSVGRVEGFIQSEKLSMAKIIKKGERFPSTGVISRTENLLTEFAEYASILELADYLKLK